MKKKTFISITKRLMTKDREKKPACVK